LEQIGAFVANLRGVKLVNLLPFHRSGLHKYERLGWAHAMGEVDAPSSSAMEQAADVFRRLHLATKIGG
jgi:pyruvate formate lyase activating enzyme